MQRPRAGKKPEWNYAGGLPPFEEVFEDIKAHLERATKESEEPASRCGRGLRAEPCAAFRASRRLHRRPGRRRSLSYGCPLFTGCAGGARRVALELRGAREYGGTSSLALGMPLPFLPAQLLWLNLVTNSRKDVALAFEPGERDLLERPPRGKREGVVSGLLWERTLVAGAVMATGALLLFWRELKQTGSLEQAQTVALTTMVLFMAFHVWNARSETRSAFRLNPLSNPFLLVAVLAALAVLVAALYLPPTQFILRVEPVDLETWIKIVPVAATILVAIELHKYLRRGGRRDYAQSTTEHEPKRDERG